VASDLVSYIVFVLDIHDVTDYQLLHADSLTTFQIGDHSASNEGGEGPPWSKQALTRRALLEPVRQANDQILPPSVRDAMRIAFGGRPGRDRIPVLGVAPTAAGMRMHDPRSAPLCFVRGMAPAHPSPIPTRCVRSSKKEED
jgi:hypothetical protein